MLKKTHSWVKFCCIFSFTLLISAALILGAGVTRRKLPRRLIHKRSLRSCDINSATQKELEDIKGVGPATAKRLLPVVLTNQWMNFPKRD